MTTQDGRTPHTEEPSEGARPPGTEEDSGRTPHPEEPAEGKEEVGGRPGEGRRPGDLTVGLQVPGGASEVGDHRHQGLHPAR